MDACAWCQRLNEKPLGAGEICDVCLGLCSFAYLPKLEAAVYLYQQSSWWVERSFSHQHRQRDERELAHSCWWCGRDGEEVKRIVAHDDVFFAYPTLCFVCDGLLISTPPSAEDLASVRESYGLICRTVEGPGPSAYRDW